MLLVSLALAGQGGAPRAVTWDDLLNALTDLDWLTTVPEPGERCLQFSSYDRASLKGRSDPKDWFANDDADQFLREEKAGERSEWVLAETEGAGAVVRVWSANPKGELRFYLDGAKEPSWAIPFQDLCGGKKAPFVEPLAGVRARGWNCHVPIPFARSLKLTCTERGFYYHVNVRFFPKGTAVPTFTPALLESPALARAAERLRQGFRLTSTPGLEVNRAEDNVLEPRFSYVHRTEGSGVFRMIQLQIAADDQRDALRATRLSIWFDDVPEPMVDAPVGDFFGTAPDWTPYRAYPMEVREGGQGAVCWFPMPFEKSAYLRLLNEGQRSLRYSLVTAIERSEAKPPPLRFHAKWRGQRDVATEPRSDWSVMNGHGPGRFVGCALSIRNPVRGWWGEGDEHAWVDSEPFPSTFGTGTEDYFGYAWCSPKLFQSAFHSQSRCDGPGNRGFTSVNRFQIADSIPFRQHLKFELELWHWVPCLVDLATTAWWYAVPDAKDAAPPLPAAAERLARPLPPLQSLHEGAIEGERLLERARVTGGKLETQDMSGFGVGWSLEEQLWWTKAKPGDRLELPIEVAAAGTWRIRAQLTRARDYAIVRFELDGEPLGAPLDLFGGKVAPTGDLELETRELAAGTHTLAIVIEGANPKAVPSHMVGVDYVRLAK